nr:immunoglobulin light chain junction region [Macaca mulatta]
CQQVYHNAFTF